MALFRELLCSHLWKQTGEPYLHDAGRTKRVDVKCIKCGKVSNVDIFDTAHKKWYKSEEGD